MGLFGNSSPFDADVEKATSEKNTTEQWGLIMDICDKVGTSATNAKDCLRSIMKRLGNQDPHIAVQAVTLLDACVNNCGKSFHLEIASRDFETEYRKILLRAQPPVAQKLRNLLKKWAEGEFKADPQLNLIPSLVAKLRTEGTEFCDNVDTSSRKKETSTSRSGTSSLQKEQEDLAKAIELSLQESKQASPRNTATSQPSSSLYPTVLGANIASAPMPQVEERKVRALYDFEAAEDNELTFFAGEIILVTDSSDPNWWKGYNQRGEGLFPANFVTPDLTPEQTPAKLEQRKIVQFSESVQVKNIETHSAQVNDLPPAEIDEARIDRLLALLHEANPEDGSQDSPEMVNLERAAWSMGPLVDAALERADRRHAQLTQLSGDLVDALNLYHQLMRDPPPAPPHSAPPPQQHLGQRPPQHFNYNQMFNGTAAYATHTSMPPFFTQAQHPAAMGAQMPTNIAIPSASILSMGQNQQPQHSLGPMPMGPPGPHSMAHGPPQQIPVGSVPPSQPSVVPPAAPPSQQYSVHPQTSYVSMSGPYQVGSAMPSAMPPSGAPQSYVM